MKNHTAPVLFLTLMLAPLITACTASGPGDEVLSLRHEVHHFHGAKELGHGEPHRAQLLLSPTRVRIELGGSYESGVHRVEAFSEALFSWNADVLGGAGFWFEVRVRRAGGATWSPWLYVGDWNLASTGSSPTVAFDGGKIDVDFFSGDVNFDAFEWRMSVAAGEGAGTVEAVASAIAPAVELHRVTVCLSGTTSVPPPRDSTRRSRDRARGTVLDVPVRSQRVEEPELAERICSPTSVAMMLAYRGAPQSTAEVAARLYDARHDIYGNWTRAVQGAFTYGVPGYLRRFSRWGEVEELVTAGQPLVASVRVGPGELRGAPYEETPGHLLVIVGFDERGDVVVNDPAAASPDEVRRVYSRQDLERVWLTRGGVAYVFLER